VCARCPSGRERLNLAGTVRLCWLPALRDLRDVCPSCGPLSLVSEDPVRLGPADGLGLAAIGSRGHLPECFGDAQTLPDREIYEP
jgi:hypothetical protein